MEKYTRIADSFVTGLGALPQETAGDARRICSGSDLGRVFLPVGGGIPPGSIVEFGIELPEGGSYHALAVVEWSNDGGLSHADRGIAVRLIEVTSKTAGDGDIASAGADAPSGESDPSAFPGGEEWVELLDSLVEPEVSVDGGRPVPLSMEIPTAAAVFVKDDGAPRFICICDLAFTVYVGACLAEIPSDTANRHVSDSEIPDNIMDNFREVLNISASLFNKPDWPHVSLGAVHVTPKPVPDDIVALIGSARSRLDLIFSMGGFGEGGISMLLVDGAI